MMFKIVYENEIHVYDLKQDYSIDQLHKKIKKSFLKLPLNIQLYFKHTDGEESLIKSDQDLKQTIQEVKYTQKIIKLFVRQIKVDIGNSNEEEKSEQMIETTLDNLEKLIKQQNQSQIICLIPDKKDKSIQQVSNQQMSNLCQNSNLSNLMPIKQIPTYINEQKERETQEFKEQQKIKKESIENQPNQLKLQKQPQHKINVHNAKCDSCEMQPIIGVRYKCVMCQNYDLCSQCQMKYSHQHPLLKICFNYQTPSKIQVQFQQQFNQKVEKKLQKEVKFYEKQIQGPQIEIADLSRLSVTQRNERILKISTQISEILNIQLQQCIDFIIKYEQYSKQTLINWLLETQEERKRAKKNLKNKNVIQKFINKIIPGWCE